ncbi:MAG: sigma-70 family RNA polymerase sigma factor [Treponema sp.]|jgi:RNA polymerase sigma-70 factor (ECF subfamily)|nr:sigma-70 family RNA polymerase sigma factor [Treponema sp.]
MTYPGLISGADDEDLMILEQILGGQKELFVLLVNRYERHIHGMGLSFFRNSDDASDFTQDVFLKVYRSLDCFEGRSRFSTWLYRIAYNTAVNSISRKKEYSSLAEDDVVPDWDTPERRSLRAELREAVLEAVRELPERYRVCVDMFFFYERTYQEIAVITGFPVNTIKSHVFRAKKFLREKLEGYIDGYRDIPAKKA